MEEHDIFDSLESEAEKLGIPFDLVKAIYEQEELARHATSHANIQRTITKLIKESIPKKLEELDQLLEKTGDSEN